MKKIGVLLFGLLLMLSAFPVTGEASGNLYTVVPIMPDNQDKGVGNYVSITTDKDTLVQELEFLVTNKTKEQMELKVTPLNALTSPNGVIQYTETSVEENAEIIDDIYSMPKYVKAENETIILKGEETKVVKVQVNIAGVKGTILGGVGFRAVKEGENEEQDEVQFKINNEVNTVIGVLVKFNGAGAQSFSVDEPFIDPMPAYYAIRLPVTYDTDRLLQEVGLKYEVLDGKRNKLFGSEVDRIFSFAPKTKANIPFPWEADDIKKGATYIITGSFTYIDENGKEGIFEFDEEFVFTGEDKVTNNGKNNTTPTVLGGFSIWWLLLLLPLLGLLWFLFFRKVEYVLYSNNPVGEDKILETNVLFAEVLPKSDAKNTDKREYAQFYKRVKAEDENQKYEYHLTRTEKVKQDA